MVEYSMVIELQHCFIQQIQKFKAHARVFRMSCEACIYNVLAIRLLVSYELYIWIDSISEWLHGSSSRRYY